MPKSDSGRGDEVKKKVRWLLRNGYTFTGRKTIKGRDYLYARKGNRYKSAGPYSTAEPYLRSLTSRKESAASKGTNDIATAARREFDQLERDAIADPSRLKDYISEFVSLKDSDLWNRFYLLAGSEALDVASVNSSYTERVRMAVAKEEQPPSYYDHVVKAMNEWIEGAIRSKRGSLVPIGTASSVCPSCGDEREAQPDPKTNFRTYRVRCNSCEACFTWSCSICKETMSFVRDDKGVLYLRCPKCKYGMRFAKPINLNSSRTEEGWRMLRDLKRYTQFLDRSPKVALEVVNLFEKYREHFNKYPNDLAMNLRSVGMSAKDADFIATLQLHRTVSTAGRPVSVRRPS